MRPLLDEHHDAGRRRHDLGERRQIEDRVERHRLGRRHERAITERLLIEHAIAAADEHDGAGQLLLRDGLAHERLDRVEPAGVEGDRRSATDGLTAPGSTR